MTAETGLRFSILGGGPAGTAAATAAASLGARVTLVEESVVGGAAHLWDCIPSKTMTATAFRIDSVRNAAKLGLVTEPGAVDARQLADRIQTISGDITRTWEELLASQDVEILVGHRASESIGILALAVKARVTVSLLAETLMVHPSLSESITDAAE